METIKGTPEELIIKVLEHTELQEYKKLPTVKDLLALPDKTHVYTIELTKTGNIDYEDAGRRLEKILNNIKRHLNG